MATEGSRRVRYAIDASDRIADVDDAWIRFARDNGAPHLTREAVVGREIWEFIAGEEVRSLYAILFQKVRSRDTAIILPFRCDSPAIRRHMRLVISPRSAETIRLEALLETIEPRPFVAVLNPDVPRSDRAVEICAFCMRIHFSPRRWAEVEDVVVRMRLFTEPRPPALRQSVCPECRRELARILDDPDVA